MTQHVLPDSRYGMTRANYNVGSEFDGLPDREVLLAANALNSYRYNKLTAQQREFVDHYLVSGFDAARAAINARYVAFDGSKESEKDARRVGNRLIKKKFIKHAIDLALDYHARRSEIKVMDLINELGVIAKTSMGDFIETDGKGKDHFVLPATGDPRLRAISEITIETYMEGRGENAREVKRQKVKLYDRMAAIEKLLKIAAASDEGRINERGVRPEAEQASTVNNVQNIVIMPVPAGQFIPAPVNPSLQTQQVLPKPAENALPDWVKEPVGITIVPEGKTIDHIP